MSATSAGDWDTAGILGTVDVDIGGYDDGSLWRASGLSTICPSSDRGLPARPAS
jgi:hypothetical protein